MADAKEIKRAVIASLVPLVIGALFASIGFYNKAGMVIEQHTSQIKENTTVNQAQSLQLMELQTTLRLMNDNIIEIKKDVKELRK